VEAYGGEDDAASHARFGRTDRDRAMYGPAGHAYVYRVYGMHRCLNVVTGPAGRPSAVLVRAVEPVAGVDAIRAARLVASAAGRRAADPERERADRARIGRLASTRLAAGPALVAAAFSVATEDDGVDLCAAVASLRIGVDRALAHTVPSAAAGIASGPRVGIAYAAPPWDSIPWRFWLVGSAAVSRAPGMGRSPG
jgi:DNA-3-methyladenine glycosylase